MGNPTQYARLIESKWVSSTGIIYSSFNQEENVFNEFDLDKYDRIDIGCDYGASNVNVFSVVGRYVKDGQSYHDIIDEVVFDAQKQGHEQADTDRCKDIAKLQNKYNLHNSYVYLPHDTSSLYNTIYYDPDIVMEAIKIKPETLECIHCKIYSIRTELIFMRDVKIL